MGVVVVLNLQFEPGRLEEFMSFVKEILPDTLAFDGCREITFNADQDDADRLLVVEQWDSRPHYERYFSWRAENGVIDALNQMLVTPVRPRYFDRRDL